MAFQCITSKCKLRLQQILHSFGLLCIRFQCVSRSLLPLGKNSASRHPNYRITTTTQKCKVVNAGNLICYSDGKVTFFVEENLHVTGQTETGLWLFCVENKGFYQRNLEQNGKMQLRKLLKMALFMNHVCVCKEQSLQVTK